VDPRQLLRFISHAVPAILGLAVLFCACPAPVGDRTNNKPGRSGD